MKTLLRTLVFSKTCLMQVVQIFHSFYFTEVQSLAYSGAEWSIS